MAQQRVLWMFNHYAQIPGNSGGTRHFSLAKQLANHGWRTIIIAASTELHTGQQRAAQQESHKLEMIDGVEYLWLKTPSYKGNGIGRVLNMLGYYRRANMRRTKLMLPAPDVVFGSSPHPFAAYAGRKMARRYNVPFFYEVRDIWPDTIIELTGMSQHHPLAMLFRWLDKKLSRAAKRIVSIPPTAMGHFEKFGIAPETMMWLPNGIDTAMFPQPTPKNDTNRFDYMYFGTFNHGNHLENILHAMRVVKESGADEIYLRLVGSGPLKEKMQQMVEQYELSNVSIEPPVAKKDIPALASEADAFVCNIHSTPAFQRYGISANKLFDYLAAGRPVVFANSAPNDPIAEAQAGISVAPEDPEALGKAMCELANMPLSERQAMGRRGRSYVENNHSFTLLAAKLVDGLNAAAAPLTVATPEHTEEPHAGNSNP
jgi:glycosyltransferase involved in cell wall biosynthesis